MANESMKILHQIRPVKLAKFLNLKVKQTSEYYEVIEKIRSLLKICLGSTTESVKFKNLILFNST